MFDNTHPVVPVEIIRVRQIRGARVLVNFYWNIFVLFNSQIRQIHNRIITVSEHTYIYIIRTPDWNRRIFWQYPRTLYIINDFRQYNRFLFRFIFGYRYFIQQYFYWPDSDNVRKFFLSLSSGIIVKRYYPFINK